MADQGAHPVVHCPPPDPVNDDERSKLAELRAQLATVSDVIPADTVLWRVKLHDADDVRSNRVLLKFLRARELDVKEALAMLTSTMKWRAEMNMEALMTEEFPPEFVRHPSFPRPPAADRALTKVGFRCLCRA